MRRLLYSLACLAPLSLAGQAFADGPDPPHKHYSASRLPDDPAFTNAKPISRYRGFLRRSVDLTPSMPPIGDQGELGSGIAWALAYAARSYYAGRNEGRDIEIPENEASPAYVYHLARRGACSDGASMTDTVEVLRRGALSLAAYPYQARCQGPPGPMQVSAAQDFRVKGYRVLDRSQIDDLKGQLERGNPVVVVFRISAAFEELRGSATFEEAEITATDAYDEVWQYLTVIGYDDGGQRVRVMNSWGRGWGDRGYAWIAYPALTNRIAGAIVLEVAPPDAAPASSLAPETGEPPPAPAEAQGAESPAPSQPSETTESIDAPSAVEPSPPQRQDMSEQMRADASKALAPPPSKEKPKLADLRNLECGKVEQIPARGKILLAGYVATRTDLAIVQDIAANEPDVALGEIALAPWPLCEALETLAVPLNTGLRPVLSTSPAGVAKNGATLRVEVTTPARPTYLYLSYFTADRTVLTLLQPQGKVLPQTPAGSRLIFGDGGKGHGTFIVGPPFGDEMMIALTSASPLFDRELPHRQTEREFLSALRKALLYKPVANLPDREVGAAIAIIRTQAE
jgi:hypothetical protein